MLVIGYNSDNNSPFYTDLDIDPDTDSASKIHKMLSKKANGATFDSILCIEDDNVVAEFSVDEDYDTSDEDDEDDDDSDDTNDDDDLHVKDEDDEDE